MIDFANLNVLAILTATVISILIGFLWYGPLFSKPWMAALGLKTEDVQSSGISMSRAVSGSIVASLATAVALAILFELAGPTHWQSGLLIAGIVWLAFSLGPMFKHIFWEDRPLVLFAIDGGYEFVSIFAAAFILIIWP